jgi:hypothetical protein
MPTTPIAAITFVAGLALIALGLVGGNLRAKKIGIPPLPTIPRAACLILGCILSGLVLFKPNWFEHPKQAVTEQQQTTNDKGRNLETANTNPKESNAAPQTTPSVPSPATPSPHSPATSPTIAQAPEPIPPPPKIYSQVLPIRFVDNQKDFAQKLRNYLAAKGYTIKTTNTNFSEIKDNRQDAGTIRIIYKSTAKDFEPTLANTIRAQFPTMRLVESLNDSARADLQIQLW